MSLAGRAVRAGERRATSRFPVPGALGPTVYSDGSWPVPHRSSLALAHPRRGAAALAALPGRPCTASGPGSRSGWWSASELVQRVVASGRVLAPARIQIGSVVVGRVTRVAGRQGGPGEGRATCSSSSTTRRRGRRSPRPASAVAQAAARLEQVDVVSARVTAEAVRQAELRLAQAEVKLTRQPHARRGRVGEPARTSTTPIQARDLAASQLASARIQASAAATGADRHARAGGARAGPRAPSRPPRPGSTSLAHPLSGRRAWSPSGTSSRATWCSPGARCSSWPATAPTQLSVLPGREEPGAAAPRPGGHRLGRRLPRPDLPGAGGLHRPGGGPLPWDGGGEARRRRSAALPAPRHDRLGERGGRARPRRARARRPAPSATPRPDPWVLVVRDGRDRPAARDAGHARRRRGPGALRPRARARRWSRPPRRWGRARRVRTEPAR